MAEKKMGPGQALVTLAILGGVGYWWYFGGGFEHQVASTTKDLQQSVASDMIQQYEIVKRQGSSTDRCMQSNMVSGSFLGAKDEANYAKWKAIAKSDCKAAGVPLE